MERVLRDTKQFAALSACPCRTDQGGVRHVAFALIAFVVLHRLSRFPEQTRGAVKERLQPQALLGNVTKPAPLKAKAALD